MIVSHAHRFIFLKTRKTAGTSVEIALSRVCADQDVITRLADDDEALRAELGGRGPQNYEPPALPRKAFAHLPAEPAKRAVGPVAWDSYLKFTIERNPWDAVVSLYYWHYRDKQAEPFEDFVMGSRIESLATKNAAIYRIDGKLAVDRVLRYEQLNDDLTRLWQDLGLPLSPDLPQAKAWSRPRSASYRSMYDDRTAQRVAEVFEPCIREFGYTF